MQTVHGLVIKNCGSTYLVKTDDGRFVECLAKGNLRLKGIKSTSPVAIGDRVQIDLEDGAESSTPVYIKEIDERRNYIIRRSSNLSKQSHILAANLDLCLLVITINNPETSTVFIDRFLVTARAYRVPVTLVFNKSDLMSDADRHVLEELCTIYNKIGYDTIVCSATDNTGLDLIRTQIKGKITLFAGNSGVGKSSLINKLLPGINLRVGQISDKHNTGMHTTTFSEMFPLEHDSGWIIDTPGVKGFGTFDMDRYEIPHYFPEMFNLSSNCRYGNCTHINEPGCAILAALESGEIAPSRYESYLSILSDSEQSKYRL